MGHIIRRNAHSDSPWAHHLQQHPKMGKDHVSKFTSEEHIRK
uniref:Uncharacterized protein n=1 Tax=Anguilla anguilla TaxID=7936 RepID=A0A0E9VMK4_ANGAN